MITVADAVGAHVANDYKYDCGLVTNICRLINQMRHLKFIVLRERYEI